MPQSVHCPAMFDLNTLALPELFEALVTPDALSRLKESMEDEDGLGGAGDVTTTSIIPAETMGVAAIQVRRPGVLAGLAPAERICRTLAPAVVLVASCKDGDHVAAGQRIGFISGQMRTILNYERPLLNLIGRLSGIATLTRRFGDAVEGTKAAICDTRKTTPGLRRLEKYAVRCGGGTFHRFGLDDAALYKDNHLAHLRPDELADHLAAAIRSARAERGLDLRFVEVEVESLDQLKRVLSIEPGLVDIVMLDNMSEKHLKRAVKLRDALAPGMQLEASGGVKLSNVRAIAETGVDRISVGALTHSAPSLDFSLDVL